jgi:hypothetical protein
MSAKARHQPSESSLMLYKEQREMIMTKKGETTMRKSSLFVLVFGSMMLA